MVKNNKYCQRFGSYWSFGPRLNFCSGDVFRVVCMRAIFQSNIAIVTINSFNVLYKFEWHFNLIYRLIVS